MTRISGVQWSECGEFIKEQTNGKLFVSVSAMVFQVNLKICTVAQGIILKLFCCVKPSEDGRILSFP